MTTFQVPRARAAEFVPVAMQRSNGARAISVVTRSSGRGAPWRHIARSAVTEAAARVGDRIDARILAEHTPSYDDNVAWCTQHWGGFEEWPCEDYTAARAAQDGRRSR